MGNLGSILQPDFTAASDGDHVPAETPSIYEQLLRRALAGSAADAAFLLWSEGSPPVAQDSSDADAAPGFVPSELEPPEAPLLIGPGDPDPLGLWCRANGVLSAAIAPVVSSSGRRLGTVALVSATHDGCSDQELARADMAAWLAAHALEVDRREGGQTKHEDAHALLNGPLRIDRALQGRPTFGSLARAIGTTLEVSFCRLASLDADGLLTIHATAGRAPDGRRRVRSAMARLPQLAEAMERQAPVPLHFDDQDSSNRLEQKLLFTASTKAGVLIPFLADGSTRGLMIVGEERDSLDDHLGAARIAALQLVADRAGAILRIHELLYRKRDAELRRRTRVSVAQQRRRLAMDLHDQVGQALTTLLLHVRSAIAEDQAGNSDLHAVERAAKDALNAARELAYGLHYLDESSDPIQDARGYAELVTSAEGCLLTWEDSRVARRLSVRTAHEVGQVIKEAVSNVVRHANATSLEVRITAAAGRVRVTVSDDGVGFIHDPARPSYGLGLASSAQRLKAVGGSFTTAPGPQGGTVVTLEAPLA
jgi:signal transduction histidine kinase